MNVVSLGSGIVRPLKAMKATLGRGLRGAGTRCAETRDASVSTGQGNSCNVRGLIATSHGEDYRFLGPTGECLCGSTMFIALIEFDDDGAVASYFTDGLCAFCHAEVTLVTEADRLDAPAG